MRNSSLVIWTFKVHVGLLVIYFVVFLVHKRTGKCAKQKTWLKQYLFFNGMIRLLMESFFELVLTASLNIHTADSEDRLPAEEYSNALAIIFLAVCILSPLYLVTKHCVHFHRVDYLGFQ